MLKLLQIIGRGFLPVIPNIKCSHQIIYCGSERHTKSKFLLRLRCKVTRTRNATISSTFPYGYIASRAHLASTTTQQLTGEKIDLPSVLWDTKPLTGEGNEERRSWCDFLIIDRLSIGHKRPTDRSEKQTKHTTTTTRPIVPAAIIYDVSIRCSLFSVELFGSQCGASGYSVLSVRKFAYCRIRRHPLGQIGWRWRTMSVLWKNVVL